MNKEAILNAACELFLREGMQKLTMRAIAREIGIPKQELCSLFAGKWELVGQSVAARLQKEDAYFDSVCAAARNPMDALLRMSAAMYDAFDAMAGNSPRTFPIIRRRSTRSMPNGVRSASASVPFSCGASMRGTCSARRITGCWKNSSGRNFSGPGY